jgi:hypothetical protein
MLMDIPDYTNEFWTRERDTDATHLEQESFVRDHQNLCNDAYNLGRYLRYPYKEVKMERSLSALLRAYNIDQFTAGQRHYVLCNDGEWLSTPSNAQEYFSDPNYPASITDLEELEEI